MKHFTTYLFAATLSLAASSVAIADDSPAEEVKEGAHAVGHGVKEGAKKVGHATKKAAKATGHAIANTARSVGHATKEGAIEVKDAVTGDKKD